MQIPEKYTYIFHRSGLPFSRLKDQTISLSRKDIQHVVVEGLYLNNRNTSGTKMYNFPADCPHLISVTVN